MPELTRDALRAARHRMPDQAFAFLPRIHAASAISRGAIASAAACVLAIVFCHLLDYCMQRWHGIVDRAWVMWPAMVIGVTCVALFGEAAQPFIYFAF